MKKPILVIMAAGIGSRYGAGIKQLAKVGPSGELVIDYSVYDAKQAGFENVLFIIRKDIEADFKELIGRRAEAFMEVAYAFQDGDDLPEGFSRPADRTKPWGTGHAVLACRDMIDSPFAVINADDYYGKEAFVKMYQYLEKISEKDNGYICAMAGFMLMNTLSDNGTVTRGVCQINEQGQLSGVHETKGIMRDAEGVIQGNYNDEEVVLNDDNLVSMNFWGFTADFMEELKTGFVDFLKNIPEGDVKAEYLLPVIVDRLLQEGRMTVDVLPSKDQWFGLTYEADREAVTQRLNDLVQKGFYPTPLF